MEDIEMVNVPNKSGMENFEPEYVSIELEEPTGEKYHVGAMLMTQENADSKGTDGVAVYFSEPILAFMMTKDEALIFAEDVTNWANGEHLRRKNLGEDYVPA
jgi:hypothetical protein